MSGKRELKEESKLIEHMKSLGFTNRLAIVLVLFLLVGLAGGFILAVMSIRHQYTGPLACWTVVFTPIGTAIGVVLGKIVDKSKAENTGPNGEGIKYAVTKAGLSQSGDSGSANSPAI